MDPFKVNVVPSNPLIYRLIMSSFVFLQSVPSTIWYRLVAGLNAQLRLVRCDQLKSTFKPIISWLETYANPTLSAYHIRVDLARFQPTASGYYQFGLVVYALDDERSTPLVDQPHGLPEVQSRYFSLVVFYLFNGLIQVMFYPRRVNRVN